MEQPRRPLLSFPIKILLAFTALFIAGVGGLFWYNAEPTAPGQLTRPKQMMDAPSVEDSKLALHNAFSSLSKTIDAISDEDSAIRSLPRFEEISTAIIAMKLDRLPPSHQSLVEELRPNVLTLTSSLKKLYKLPGVQAHIEPAVSPLLSRLQAFTNVSAD